MIKFIKNIFLWIIAIPVFIYAYFTRQAYYVSGTFKDGKGIRMFFKTTFVTHSGIMPIKSLEKSMTDYFECEGVVILFFHRIPYCMLKYVEEDYGINIEVKPKK